MTKFTPIRGKKIRVTELDDCGAVLPTSRFIVTDGFITVTLTPNVEEGTTIQTRLASGAMCINEEGNPSFSNFGVELEFCGVDPELLTMVTNAQEYETLSEVTGFTVPEGEMTGRFALELWTGLAGAACGAGGTETSGYLLLPLVSSGSLGDITVGGEDSITFSMTNSKTKGGNAWGTGPYEVVLDGDEDPAVLPTALDPYDHLLLTLTEVAPPAVTSGATVVPVPVP